jgi:TIR domain
MGNVVGQGEFVALISEERLRKLARQRAQRPVSALIEAEVRSKMAAARERYDIFLSHCFRDKTLTDGLVEQFESLGFTVYLDWREDPKLDRSRVNRDTAEVLRKRLETSSALFYVPSENSSGSKWMPWELGYMDGKKGTAAILPVSKSERADDYEGQEYLGLYPYVTVSKNKNDEERIWIREDKQTYVVFQKWVKGKQPYEH